MGFTRNNVAGIAVQLDLATFPSHDLRDVTDFTEITIDLGTDQDNGSCTVTLTAVHPDADERRRLYVYDPGGALLFNGECVGFSGQSNEGDRSFTIHGRDAMARLRNRWTKEDRVYNATGLATDGSTIQNLVEASGIDASLTSINDTMWAIGVAQDVVLHGGVPDVLTGDPGQADVPLDLIKKIDESTPLYVTFSAGDGAVYRRPRALTSPVEYYATGGGSVPCWDVSWERSADELVNACKVIGLEIVGVSLESLAQASNSYVFDPPAYITEEINSPLIEDQTHADAVTAAIVAYKNGRKQTISFTTALTSAVKPSDTVAVTDSFLGLGTTSIFVTKIQHRVSAADAISIITGEVYLT